MKRGTLRDSILTEERWHGLLFDAAVLAGSLLLARLFPTLDDSASATAVGLLLLVAVLTQMAGAWLKKEPLGRRLWQAKNRRRPHLASHFMSLLLWLHFILFSVIVLFALMSLGVYREPTDGLSGNDYWVGVSLVVGGLTTWVVRRAAQPREPGGRQRVGKTGLEYVADGLLWVSVLIVTRLFWDGLIDQLPPPRGLGLSGRGLVLLGALNLLFVFFYLPSRYLYLIEDHRSPLTWVQVWLAMVPVVLEVVEG